MMQGRLGESVAEYDRAVALRPDFTVALYNRGLALQAMNNMREATASFRRALDTDPEYLKAMGGIGFVLSKTGEHAEALRWYERVLKARPDSLWVRLETAWLMATSPDITVRHGRRARALALAACDEVEWRSWRALDILAAAHAECGAFADAVECVDRALGVLEGKQDGHQPAVEDVELAGLGLERQAIRKKLEERRELYRSGKPYRWEKEPAAPAGAGD
jgi:tetratricopeptide (TPR) repeat protein